MHIFLATDLVWENIFSFKVRAAEKAAARERDVELLGSGEVSHAEMARENSDFVRGVRHTGPAKCIQALAAKLSDEDSAEQPLAIGTLLFPGYLRSDRRGRFH